MIVRIALLALWLAASPAAAACYADYKAKQDNPLRLHYGVVAVSDAACRNRAAAQQEVARRVAAGGWTLLNVISTFDDSGLAARRKDAGPFFLRF